MYKYTLELEQMNWALVLFPPYEKFPRCRYSLTCRKLTNFKKSNVVRAYVVNFAQI
jgi:hypothetical protein